MTGLSPINIARLLPCLAVQQVGGCCMQNEVQSAVLVHFESWASLDLNVGSHPSLENCTGAAKPSLAAAPLYRSGSLYVLLLCPVFSIQIELSHQVIVFHKLAR